MATFTAGTITVSSAGTRVQVTSTPTPIRREIPSTSGKLRNHVCRCIYRFGSVTGIEFAVAGGNESIDFTEGRPGDLSEFYCDAATNGDKIHYMAVQV